MSNDMMIHSLDDRIAELRLSPFQEQKVRDMLAECAALMDAEKQIAILEQHFGGREEWRKAASHINDWAKEALPPRIVEALSTTAEGVLAMHRIMVSSGSQSLPSAPDRQSETEIKQMMRDPRYWRDQDPEFVDRVREGFRELYGERS